MPLSESYEKVRQFHLAASLPAAPEPTSLSDIRQSARCDWLLEEVEELRAAKTIEDQADALMDIIYLALGGFVELGANPSAIFDIVHDNNMSKLWNDKSAHLSMTGKLLKPPDWRSPKESILREIARQLTHRD